MCAFCVPEIPQNILNDMSTLFTIERDKVAIGTAHGFFCSKDYPSTIQLVEDTDIRNGDWLIDSITNQRYYANDIHPILINGKPAHWMVKYQTERDYNLSTSHVSSSIINIQSVTGNSVIGSQENVTLNIGNSLDDIKTLIEHFPLSDQKQAEELLDELKRVESSPHPILVEGSLAKFKNLLNQHKDLLATVGRWTVKLLIGQ